MKSLTLKTLLALFGLAAASAPAAVVTFDTAGDLANNFNLNGTSGFYAEMGTGGVNDSRAVAPSQVSGSGSGILKTESYLGSDTGLISISIFLKWQNATS